MKVTRGVLGPRVGWKRYIAMAVVFAALVFSSQGCCSCSKCAEECGLTGNLITPEDAKRLVVEGKGFTIIEKTLGTDPSTTKCVTVKEPHRIKAKANEKIAFVNNSNAPLTFESSVPCFFDVDGPFPVAHGESKVVRIRKDVIVDPGAIVTINMEVQPPREVCPDYPGPSIEFD